jgi:hypothetical protein
MQDYNELKAVAKALTKEWHDFEGFDDSEIFDEMNAAGNRLRDFERNAAELVDEVVSTFKTVCMRCENSLQRPCTKSKRCPVIRVLEKLVSL